MKNDRMLSGLWGIVNLLQYSMVIAITGIFISSCSPKVETKETFVIGDIPVCGTVQFSDGCGDPLDSLISYGIALVHHMTYDEAEVVFDRVIKENPACFWGHWGKALTFIHPVWPDVNSEEQLKAGLELADTALKLAKTEKEKAYGNAIAAYFGGALTKTKLERLKTYEKEWESAHNTFPDDLEAKSFYALTLISTAEASDKTYKNQLKAGKLAEEVLQVIPDHPGGFHYIIHAYDNPVLGPKAIEVAKNYDKIAPEVPHALHMPTHIFTRLGMWEESIEWNLRSAKAALENPVQGNTSLHYFHALDYLVYSYLQRGEDIKAQKILEEYKKISTPYQKHFITAYALAAMEGRYYVERQDWENAAKLTIPNNGGFSWESFPESEAIIYFAKGLGAARAGAAEVAESAIQKLQELQQLTINPYWKDQIEIQKTAVSGWLAYAEGDKEKALNLMKMAADKESATEKHPVTPGELLPAVELMADMLLLENKPSEAIAYYEAALERSPGRFNSLYGAAHSAELSGDKDKADKYYKLLAELSSEAEINLKQRDLALAYLNKKM